jgi:(p)ppGpp synthase/HD superfamily hydrolase
MIDQGKKDIQSTHWRTEDMLLSKIVHSLEHLKRLEKQKQDRVAERQRQRTAPIRDKLDTYRAKEDQTMAMFRQMAEEQKKRGGL